MSKKWFKYEVSNEVLMKNRTIPRKAKDIWEGNIHFFGAKKCLILSKTNRLFISTHWYFIVKLLYFPTSIPLYQHFIEEIILTTLYNNYMDYMD